MKTHLLTKKRALISSVAMLLVAIIALGTATFAWFTKSTSATAENLSVKTVKASEIMLSDNDTTHDWTDQLDYNTLGKVLKPASSADGVHWYTANATNKGSYEAPTPSSTIPEDQIGKYVFKNQLNVSNMGAAAVEKVTISFNLKEGVQKPGAKYLRLALVEADKRGTDANIIGDFASCVYAEGTDKADAFVPNDEGTSVITKKISTKDGSNASVTIGDLGAKDTATSTKYYNLYVWFEGQDTDCYDYNAGNVMSPITFTVTGDTVNQQTGN